MDCFEHDIAEMKSDTLCRLGRKVEIACGMLGGEEQFHTRLSHMIERVEHDLTMNLKRKKRRQLMCVLERLKKKSAESAEKIRLIKQAKTKAINDYKAQREILGLTDHTFINGFLKNL
ncbi:hypothetical protein EP073_11170 [Geovibrio thiophilus]|uniref:Uncharacterized protein n=1 Tax=Geovibrio thiophilus TaxID=139438 RepID=A0A410K0L7_9BACT|nr:hypothetical protein [Geovibrio thiophilus]QAR33942.1 hypothetical protein EP073_11170 [Geovibrio thiophilus]